MQGPLPSARHSTRPLRRRWLTPPTDDQHRPDHQTEPTTIHSQITDGKRLTTPGGQITIRWHFQTTRIQTSHRWCRRRTHHIQTTPMVAWRRLDTHHTTPHSWDTVDNPLDTTRRLRQTTQPTSTTDTTTSPRERLGDPSHPLPTTTIPLPHYTGADRPGSTTTTTRQSRQLHLGPVATRQPTVPTGNISHNSWPGSTKAIGNPSPHFNVNASWHYQITTPPSPNNIHPHAAETPC